MKVTVKERFSIKEKGKIKFYEVNNKEQEIDNTLGIKAIELGYVEEVEEKKGA